jgi:hypothetical protein
MPYKNDVCVHILMVCKSHGFSGGRRYELFLDLILAFSENWLGVVIYPSAQDVFRNPTDGRQEWITFHFCSQGLARLTRRNSKFFIYSLATHIIRPNLFVKAVNRIRCMLGFTPHPSERGYGQCMIHENQFRLKSNLSRRPSGNC